MATMTEWARKEVELACKKENPDRKDWQFDYGCACYESALKAFECLMEDGHSGMSFGFTKNILIRLMDGNPLTPIEDTEDAWNMVEFDRYEFTSYQCKRKSSLFKDVYADGTIKYKDVDRFLCFDMESHSTYSSGLVSRVIDEMFPITMPYCPGRPWRVNCLGFLTDKRNGDFDTVGIFTILVDEVKEDISRFFKLDNWCDRDWVEITKEEFEERKLNRIDGEKEK